MHSTTLSFERCSVTMSMRFKTPSTEQKLRYSIELYVPFTIIVYVTIDHSLSSAKAYISQLENEDKIPEGKELIRPTVSFVAKVHKQMKVTCCPTYPMMLVGTRVS